jgi:O-antigen ligase
VVTRARAAWLGFGLACIYMVVRTRSLWLMAPLGLGAATLLSVDVLRGAVESRLTATSTGDPSLWGRYMLWVYALRVLKENWLLGVGMENFRYVKHLYGYPEPLSVGQPYNSHNLFLEFFVDLGIAGLLALLYLMGRTFLALDRRIREQAPQGRWLMAGLNAGLLAYAVDGLLDCVIWSHGAFMLLGLVIGLALAVARTERQAAPPALPVRS